MNTTDPSGRNWLHDCGRDLRFAGRALRRTPLFTTVTVVSLGLGVALATVTLAVTSAYLLRSLPYPDAKRLYHVMYAPPGPYEPRGMTALDWSGLSDVVDATIIAGGAAYYLGEGESMQLVRGTRVSRGFIDGLGVRPILGQAFSDDDFKPGAPPIALLGHALWRDRFNADPNILGREIRATPEDRSTASVLIRVAGVLPPGFWFGRTSESRPDLLLPLHTPARAYMARLRHGVPVARAEQRITEAARAVGTDFRPGWTGVHLESVHDRYVAGLRPLLVGISAAAGLVLVLVSCNVAILVLLRALQRRKDVAVRVALGAERRHLLRMQLAETGLLCVGALALGLTLSAFALRVLAPVIEARLGRPPPGGPSAIFVDANVVLISGGAGLVVALALAFLPLLTHRRRAIADTLRRSGPGATDGPGMRRLRATFIAFEVAGALVLLTSGGLMIRTVRNLMRTDLGFDPGQVARIRIVLPSTYRDRATLAPFYEKLAGRLAEVAPASTVSSSFPAFYPTNRRPVESEANIEHDLSIGVLPVGPGYFAVHGIELRQGREFTLADRVASEPVAMVSESLARQLWPQGSALGRRVRTSGEGDPNAAKTEWRTVVGVVRDVRQTYDDEDLRDLYLAFLQVPTRFGNIQVRTDRPVTVPLSRLGTLAAQIDPLVQVAEPKRLASEDQQFARVRFMTAMLGGFATFATLLALFGIYGVTAYAVQQREREIAIRVAVGATQSAVIGMFLRQGAVVIGVGLALGLWATSASGQIIEHQIHGVRPFDPMTVIAASTFLLACALFATWWPARHTANADLLKVLKEE